MSVIQIFSSLRQVQKGEGGGRKGKSPLPLPFFPSSLSPTPTPFDACYAGEIFSCIEIKNLVS